MQSEAEGQIEKLVASGRRREPGQIGLKRADLANRGSGIERLAQRRVWVRPVMSQDETGTSIVKSDGTNKNPLDRQEGWGYKASIAVPNRYSWRAL